MWEPGQPALRDWQLDYEIIQNFPFYKTFFLVLVFHSRSVDFDFLLRKLWLLTDSRVVVISLVVVDGRVVVDGQVVVVGMVVVSAYGGWQDTQLHQDSGRW